MSSLLSKTPSTPHLSLGSMPIAMAGQTYTVAGEKQTTARSTKKLSLTVFEAVGGYIVEIDNSHDNYTNLGELYIIGEDKDLGQEIGKIITHNKLKT
jgi:hypothetical protein